MGINEIDKAWTSVNAQCFVKLEEGRSMEFPLPRVN